MSMQTFKTRGGFFFALFSIVFGAIMLPGAAQAFCGFYVSKAGADLFNQASKVIMARSENRTVLTMSNDFRGSMREFAIVIPVPEVLKKSQINVAENRIVEHLDAYTSPRLVEYFDTNPCQQYRLLEKNMAATMSTAEREDASAPRSAAALGVTIEAEYTVGEYDIVILSAKQSNGLLLFLNQEGYKLPKGAKRILGSYIKQDMKFFLAKVNLDEQARSGYSYLRPLQMAFESEKFMLPIRLGTLNANGPQDLLLYTLTRKGRVETSNYRTVKIPSNQNIPTYVKNEGEFGEFYKAMFTTAVNKENMKVAFLEYAWDMGWCDPCAADPLPNEDLQTLGVWWLNTPPRPVPMRSNQQMLMPQPAPANVFVTRLHVRYDAKNFPEDLMLHETADRQNFQGRYVLQHPWTGKMDCQAGRDYLKSLPRRFEEEAKTLARLTGWNIADIRKKMEENGQIFKEQPMPKPKPWWDKIWKDQ